MNWKISYAGVENVHVCHSGEYEARIQSAFLPGQLTRVAVNIWRENERVLADYAPSREEGKQLAERWLLSKK